jgi:hypothetical protein
MDTTEIKKVLYKESPIARCRRAYFSNETKDMISHYKTNTSLGEISFHVPNKDMGDSPFKVEEEAKLLIRWLSENDI